MSYPSSVHHRCVAFPRVVPRQFCIFPTAIYRRCTPFFINTIYAYFQNDLHPTGKSVIKKHDTFFRRTVVPVISGPGFFHTIKEVFP